MNFFGPEAVSTQIFTHEKVQCINLGSRGNKTKMSNECEVTAIHWVVPPPRMQSWQMKV